MRLQNLAEYFGGKNLEKGKKKRYIWFFWVVVALAVTGTACGRASGENPVENVTETPSLTVALMPTQIPGLVEFGTGAIYESGENPDYEEALKAYLKAAEAGHVTKEEAALWIE